MKDIKPRRASVPASYFVRLMLPFAVPILLTLMLVILVGDRWPRQIAHGSGLKLAGLCATALTAIVVWWWVVRNESDTRIRKFAALLCCVTGVMGWPVWSVGVLPSVNGAALGRERTVTMALEKTEATTKSKMRGYYHWAWLKAQDDATEVVSGRYFISEAIYDRLRARTPSSIDVTVAPGMLGAAVVTAIK